MASDGVATTGDVPLTIPESLLRAAVAALRATRATAVDAARDQARAATSSRLRLLIAASTLSFVFGVGFTAALGAFAIYVLGLCP